MSESDSEACPRCDAPITQEFYGPCAACRTALRNARIKIVPEDRKHAKAVAKAMAARLKRLRGH